MEKVEIDSKTDEVIQSLKRKRVDVTTLRMAMISPKLLDPKVIKKHKLESAMQGVHEHSPLVEWVVADIKRRLEIDPGVCAIVFTHFVGENDDMKKALDEQGISSERVCGSDSPQQKDAAKKNFKTGFVTVLVANMQCAAVGLNLQAASVVYLLSADWNPCREIQAIGRAHRKGQKRDVEAIVVIPMDKDGRCVDEIMQSTQARKLVQLQNVERTKYPHAARITQELLDEAEERHRG
jgi:superfamily II DNA or RNA helicase